MDSSQRPVRLASLSVLGELASEMLHLVHRLISNRRVLLVISRIELKQRYAGSYLGSLWYPLYWVMLLAMYCFVYVAIFRQRLPEFGQFGYVLFIFAGLVPYFGINDAIASGTPSSRPAQRRCCRATSHMPASSTGSR